MMALLYEADTEIDFETYMAYNKSIERCSFFLNASDNISYCEYSFEGSNGEKCMGFEQNSSGA